MNKKGITFLLSILGLVYISPVFAMSYPPFAGITISNSTTAAEFVVYFFNLAIAAGAFIAGVVLFIAGVDYVSSRGEPAKIESAKSRIKNAFLGLIILLSSFMILNIINPQLTNIKIDKLEKTADKKVVIPEGMGVYLYDSPNYVSTIDPLRVIGTVPNFETQGFNRKVQSIKFVNSTSDFKFGAIIFTEKNKTDSGSGYELRGNCSFALNSIPDLGVISGQDNNPPIGNNKLSSIIVFKTKAGSPSVKLYNIPNCTKKNNDYGVQKDENNMCTINSSDSFINIKEACPNLKGDVFSIETSSSVGVLLKASDKNQAGRCQFFESNDSNCINTVKYSYVYNVGAGEIVPSVTPQSFMLFPLVK
jgi:hypothetical protein